MKVNQACQLTPGIHPISELVCSLVRSVYHTVKGFGTVNKAEIDIFLELWLGNRILDSWTRERP